MFRIRNFPPLGKTVRRMRSHNLILFSHKEKGEKMTKKILLVCGAGASSGFMAAAARKAAKKAGLNYEIKAKSESELVESLPGLDLLLVAPHLSYMIDETKGDCEAYNVAYALIPKKIYGTLDGNGLVVLINEKIGN